MDKVQPYRQPMVTATGIFLGFMLEFTNQWTRGTASMQRFRDVVVALSIIASLFFLLLTLFRMLRMSYPTDPARFYRRTLLYFLMGIGIPFLGFILIITEKFVVGFVR